MERGTHANVKADEQQDKQQRVGGHLHHSARSFKI